MKKILVASSALVAVGFAGAAQASEPISLSISGYMEQWAGVSSQDDAYEGYNAFQSDTEVHFKGATTLDNGIEVGLSIELEGEGGNSGTMIDEQYAYVNGGFGQFKIGAEDGAANDMTIIAPSTGPVGANDGDLSNWVQISTNGANYYTQGGDAKRVTYYTPVISGFRAGVSYTDDKSSENNDKSQTNNSVVSLGVEYKGEFDGVSVAVSATGEEDQDTTGQWFHVGGTVGFGNFTVGASYGENDDDLAGGAGTQDEGFDLGVAYALDAATVSATYYNTTEGQGVGAGEDELDVVHLGLTYTLGAGVSWQSSVFWFDNSRAGTTTDNDGYGVVTGIDLSF